LSPEKGVSYLLDALRIVLDRQTPAHLVIVGSGPEEATLRAQASRLELDTHITWFGTVKHADLGQYLRAGDIFVLPSLTTKIWSQQLSSAAWHAMAAGLPVVSTQTGCMNEFTPTETGILVPQRDARALADAISVLLLDDRRRQSMAAAARAYAERRFDARKNVEQAEQTILQWCR
jgi:rhamnosyl/mannosyltransferase